jgi:hypothetical protein
MVYASLALNLGYGRIIARITDLQYPPDGLWIHEQCSGAILLAAIYPAVWGLAQLGAGALSDQLGRKWLIAGGRRR